MTTKTTKSMPDLTGFMTTQQVAEKYKVPRRYVQRALVAGMLEHQKVGYFYLVWGPALPKRFPIDIP